MKILLMGEFSGFHSNLKDGLVALGHECIVAGTMDGSKKIPVDINIGPNRKGLLGKVEQLIKSVFFVFRAEKYDVIQLVNPIVFTKVLFINEFLIRRLLKKGKKTYLAACGCDAFFVEFGSKKLKYSPVADNLKYDFQSDRHPRGGKGNIRWNSKLISLVNGIIPIMYEYSVGYFQESNLNCCIPLPISCSDIKYSENVVSEKLIVFHGLTRYGFKGTRHVEEAFKYLREKYPEKIECIIAGNLPLSEYLEIIKKTNVVVDQTYFYSNGMNALYSLAMGKVVLGGAEPESFSAYGIPPEDCPVVNITPDYMSIVESIESLLFSESLIQKTGRKSRDYVEKHHNSRIIAKKFLDAWN